MTAKKTKTKTARPAPIDPARVAERYLSNEDWADAFEGALVELATERAAQVARVTAFLGRTRPEAEPEEVSPPPKFRGPNRPLNATLSQPPVNPSPERDLTGETILEFVVDHGPVGAGEVAQHFGFAAAKDAPAVVSQLKQAVEQGLLTTIGAKRGLKYQAA